MRRLDNQNISHLVYGQDRWPRNNVTGIYTDGYAACNMICSYLNAISRAGGRLFGTLLFTSRLELYPRSGLEPDELNWSAQATCEALPD